MQMYRSCHKKLENRQQPIYIYLHSMYQMLTTQISSYAKKESRSIYLPRDWAKPQRESEKFATPADKTQLLSLSKRPRILTAEMRSELYWEALLSAAQRWVLASFLASCRKFSRWAQFIYNTNSFNSLIHKISSTKETAQQQISYSIRPLFSIFQQKNQMHHKFKSRPSL